MRGWKNTFHANRDQKKGVAILISDKVDFKTKAVKKDRERHYIMIKGSIQDDITFINISGFQAINSVSHLISSAVWLKNSHRQYIN